VSDTARPQAEPGRARRRGLLALALAYGVALVVALAVGRALQGHEPLWIALWADVAATCAVFVFSVAYGNSSLYDPYWSVAPVPIVVYWAWIGGPGPRAVAVLALVFAWGARLTGNQLVRWRGVADEDYRYLEVRRRTGRAYWPASLLTIHLFPTAWVFLGLLPLYPALALPSRHTGLLDAVATVVAAGGIALEATADLQLRRFLRQRREPSEILTEGVWAWSRHPNYLGEILFWWGLYLFGVAAAPRWAWSAVGALAITALFLLVSVPWMDRRMLERHPGFAERLRTTPALVPWPWRRRA
jgi:steroid 5-alpha reductase family enzyme